MSADLEQLEAKLAELRNERAAVEVTMTKEDLVAKVGEYLQVARSHAAGSSRLALAGQAVGVDLEAVLAEDLLADDGLAGRIVARLERQGFGELSDRQRKQRVGKLDEQIEAATAQLREAKRQAALEAVEREFAA